MTGEKEPRWRGERFFTLCTESGLESVLSLKKPKPRNLSLLAGLDFILTMLCPWLTPWATGIAPRERGCHIFSNRYPTLAAQRARGSGGATFGRPSGPKNHGNATCEDLTPTTPLVKNWRGLTPPIPAIKEGTMTIIAFLLLPIIVFSHLAAQWYLFHFIGYLTIGWIRSPRRADRRKTVVCGQWPVISGRESVSSGQ
jgi:hypothetical protein